MQGSRDDDRPVRDFEIFAGATSVDERIAWRSPTPNRRSNEAEASIGAFANARHDLLLLPAMNHRSPSN